jgi:hypothetical protein
VLRLDLGGRLTVLAGSDFTGVGAAETADNGCPPPFHQDSARLTQFGWLAGPAVDPGGRRVFVSEPGCRRIDQVDLR